LMFWERVRFHASCLGIAVVISLLVLGMAWADEGKRDPQTGRIRLLYIGDATNTRNPVFIYKSDPTFSPTLIPSCRDVLFAAGLGMDDIMRYMRQYMPKNFEQMKNSYDVVILSDVCVLNFRSEQINWIEKCVRENGFGLAMIGGIESFGGGSNYPSWAGTAVADSLPVEFSDTEKNAPSGSYRLIITSQEDELMRSLPWKSAPPFSGLNIVKLRDGANELAKAVSALKTYPLMASWGYGQGRTLAFTPDWTPGWGAEFCQWDYYLDFAADLGMYLARVTVPQDLALVHSNRMKFFALANRKALLSSLFDFVDRFGANTAKLEARVQEVDEIINSAQDLYIRQDYESSLSRLTDAENVLKEIENGALRLKDRALMWVYIIEWFATLGTALVCGAVLWLVMVRRKLYRDVRVTRAR